jgi:hypothetical protein
LPVLRRLNYDTVELPEPIVDTVNANVSRTPVAWLVCHDTVERDQRTRCADAPRREPTRLQEGGSELLTKEAGRSNEIIRAAKPLRH